MSGETRGDGGTGPDEPAGQPLDGPGAGGPDGSGTDAPGGETAERTPATWPALDGGTPPGSEPADVPDAAPPAADPLAGTERFDADGRPLDPRAIARASLDADRNWSLWVISLAVVLVVSLAVAAGTPVGALVLAAFLACCAVVRGVVRGGPAALVVRSRATDVTVLAGLAVSIAVLSQVVPVPAP